MGDLTAGTAFAEAYREAEQRKAEAEAEAARLAAEAEALLAVHRVYDPMPFAGAEPHDLEMYAGTGIGALYEHYKRSRRTDREVDATWHRSKEWIAERRRQARWLSKELAGWTIGRES